MKKIFLVCMICVSLVSQSFASSAKVLILLDLSDSAPLVTQREFSKKVASYMMKQVSNLSVPNEVEIAFIGEFLKQQHKRKIYPINRVSSPKKVGIKVAKYIYSIHKQLNNPNSNFKPETMTDILGALSLALQGGNRFDHIYIYSDMYQFSQEMDCYKMVAFKKLNYPRLISNKLKNTKVTVLGASVGYKNNTLVKANHLQKIWENIFQDSGAILQYYSRDF
jgi:hypothetical protein